MRAILQSANLAWIPPFCSSMAIASERTVCSKARPLSPGGLKSVDVSGARFHQSGVDSVRLQLPPEARVYRVTKKWGIFGVLGLLFFLALIGVVVWTYFNRPGEISTRQFVLFLTILPLFTATSAFLIWCYACYSATTREGIYHYAPNKGLTFIPWDEIAHVTSDEVGKRLILRDAGEGREVRVEYQVVGFDELSALIEAHAPRRAQMITEAQRKFRINRAFNPSIAIGCLVCPAVMWLAWPSRLDAFVAFGVIPFVLIGLWLSVYQRVEIGPEGVRLKRPIGERLLPYESIESIETLMVAGQDNDRTMVVAICTADGKSHQLKFLQGSAKVLHQSLQVALDAARRVAARSGGRPA